MHRRLSMILLLLLLLPTLAVAAERSTSPGPGYYTKQSVLGLVGTGVGFFGGGLLGMATGGSDQTEYDAIGRFLVGGLLGTAIGTAAGVHLAGNDDENEGSFGATLAGSAVGTLSGLAWIAAFEHADPTIPLLGVALPTVGAILGFESSRRLRIEANLDGSMRISWKANW